MGRRVGSPPSDPAQVAFSSDGQTLLVTDRASNSIHAFAVDGGGIAQPPTTYPSSGTTPYGFAVTPDGTVIVTEAAGGEVGRASASSYRLNGSGRLVPVSAVIPSSRSEVCWAVVSDDCATVFVTNFGDGTISSYSIAGDGSIALREAVAATTVEGQPGIRDETLSSDGRYLYALHADAREVFAWEIGDGGALHALGSTNGLPATAAGLAAS
jgi:6-phosphogluconolactonase